MNSVHEEMIPFRESVTGSARYAYCVSDWGEKREGKRKKVERK